MNAIPISWISILIQSNSNWIFIGFNCIDIKFNWTPFLTISLIDFKSIYNWIKIEIPYQWLLIFIIQQTRKTSKIYLEENRKGGTLVLCLTILIKVPFYLKINWTCGIVKLVTMLELLRWWWLMDLLLVWPKLVMIIIVIGIICQYNDNDSNMRQILMKKVTLVIGRWNMRIQ